MSYRPDIDESKWRPDLDFDGVKEPESVSDYGREERPHHTFQIPPIGSQGQAPKKNIAVIAVAVAAAMVAGLIVFVATATDLDLPNNNQSSQVKVVPADEPDVDSEPWKAIYDAVGMDTSGDRSADLLMVSIWADSSRRESDIEFELKTFTSDLKDEGVSVRLTPVYANTPEYRQISQAVVVSSMPCFVMVIRDDEAIVVEEITVDNLHSKYIQAVEN